MLAEKIVSQAKYSAPSSSVVEEFEIIVGQRINFLF